MSSNPVAAGHRHAPTPVVGAFQEVEDRLAAEARATYDPAAGLAWIMGGAAPTGHGVQVPLGEDLFDVAVAAFKAGRDAVAEARDDLDFEDCPAPKRLAQHAVAIAATAYRDGEEAGTGRLVLLHDPAGQEGWTGTFRLVAQVHADVEEEMAADPLLGEVGWSWLTDALDLHAPGYSAPSGTVTREITEGYGTKADEPPMTVFELRASWCPADDEIDGCVVAWCDLLVAAAGLPAQPPGTRARTRGRRRAHDDLATATHRPRH